METLNEALKIAAMDIAEARSTSQDGGRAAAPLPYLGSKDDQCGSSGSINNKTDSTLDHYPREETAGQPGKANQTYPGTAKKISGVSTVTPSSPIPLEGGKIEYVAEGKTDVQDTVRSGVDAASGKITSTSMTSTADRIFVFENGSFRAR